MNKCPKCGKECQGRYCTACGTKIPEARICPNCGTKSLYNAKFCSACGYSFLPTPQPVSTPPQPPKKRRKAPLIALLSILLVLAIGAGVGITVFMFHRHDGTYYLYSGEQYDYETYYILKGHSYTDEDGYTGDVEFDGNQVKLYAELFGVRDVFASGTIDGDVIKLKSMGAEMTFIKKHVHIFENGKCTICGWQDTDNGLEFNKNGKSAYMVTGIGRCEDTAIVIPERYDGYPVTAIGDKAFEHCRELTSVTIPNSVTSIGDWAFSGCRGLTSIDIPDSVTLIGGGAFEDCSGLTSISIPDSVNEIEDFALAGCSGLAEITIPGSVTSIGRSAFYGCSGLSGITIPDSVTSIEERAFYGCSGLRNVYFENPNKWKVDYDQDGDGVIDRDAFAISELEDPTQAAKYLTDTYVDYDWTYWNVWHALEYWYRDWGHIVVALGTYGVLIVVFIVIPVIVVVKKKKKRAKQKK